MTQERQDQVVKITLVVKTSDPKKARELAERELVKPLNNWFTRDKGPAPFPEGSLLHWNLHAAAQCEGHWDYDCPEDECQHG